MAAPFPLIRHNAAHGLPAPAPLAPLQARSSVLSRFLNADLSINDDEIDLAAHTAATVGMQRQGAAERTTWGSLYAQARERYADQAEAQRACEVHHIEQDAEDDRRAALPERERRILALREAAHLAPMIDHTPSAIAAQEAAERELVVLMAEGV